MMTFSGTVLADAWNPEHATDDDAELAS